MAKNTIIALAALSAILIAPREPQPRHSGLDATLWVQTSAEYGACARQTWRAAELRLEAALTDATVDAVLARETPVDLTNRPVAVIVDVDETVLDNSPYQARLIRDGATFDLESWTAWVEQAAARPIAGALATLRRAAGLGVRVFYVTNRDAAHEEATRANLAKWGFPLSTTTDTVLTRGEKDGWGSDKTSRRRHVAQTHRVLFVVGDDLNDFIAARELTRAERDEVVQELDAWWGERWFILPNPTYGSWMKAAIRDGGEDPTAAKIAALDPRR